MKRLGVIVTLAVAFCFIFTSLVQAGPDDPVTEQWARQNLVNKRRASKIPGWQIIQPGTAKSVKWVNWPSNPRFAVYDSGTPADPTDDLVLDRATGMVWTRDVDIAGQTMTWRSARDFCIKHSAGNVLGFSLPSVQEISTLFDAGGTLPPGTDGLWVNTPTDPADGFWTSTRAHCGDPAAG